MGFTSTDALQKDVDALKNFIASRDADTVKKATAGLGTDEKALMFLCERTKAQLERIDGFYHTKYEKSLLDVVQGDIGGNLGKLVGYSLQPVDDLGATLFTLACAGVGVDQSILIDLACLHSKAELAAIKTHWEAKHDGSMLDRLNEELKGDFKDLLVGLLRGSKEESAECDADLAEKQAKKLYKAGVGKTFGTDEDVFAEVLGSASRAQIQGIKDAYEKNHGMSLKKAIESECGGDFERLCTALLAPSREAYIATALKMSFGGIGTDDGRVARLLAVTDKRQMAAVKEYYLDTYGKSLSESLKDEMSGDFLEACLKWISAEDPTQGQEYATATIGESQLATSLTTEKTNLLDFVAKADAMAVHGACKGMGTDDTELINVICGRPKAHIEKVDKHYHALYETSLLETVRSECAGFYQQLLEYALMQEDDGDAFAVKQACDGFGTDEIMLIQALAPLSNSRITAMKAKYAAQSDPMIDRLNSELSGDLHTLVLHLLRAERNESAAADLELAQTQAQQLYEAGQGKIGTDEGPFISILTTSSWAQIAAIKEAYEQLYSCSLQHAIKGETGGVFEDGLILLLSSPDDQYAMALKRSFAGLGTNDAAVARALGANDKPAVARIAARYFERYSVTLVEALKSELSGDFQRACLAWVQSADNAFANVP